MSFLIHAIGCYFFSDYYAARHSINFILSFKDKWFDIISKCNADFVFELSWLEIW